MSKVSNEDGMDIIRNGKKGIIRNDKVPPEDSSVWQKVPDELFSNEHYNIVLPPASAWTDEMQRNQVQIAYNYFSRPKDRNRDGTWLGWKVVQTQLVPKGRMFLNLKDRILFCNGMWDDIVWPSKLATVKDDCLRDLADIIAVTEKRLFG